MNEPTVDALTKKSCVPCEGGVPIIDAAAAKPYLAALPDWSLDEAGTMISRQTNCGNFVKAMKLLGQVAEVAEDQQHHPDLHLTGYRHVRIDLTTHAIGGLSENDFIVAAKIDEVLKG
ncbi:putative pterin-4-alpha-carbinolamine dehydratase [Rubripirellula tenax]|uniref:4a-hydroxytetrahydrobiopterin dehydratase n=1 Tax=Rubripirellula tenax TaxID=2528015 RepID=A0A5C6FK29_9BACT|nr:4a-hydroxytetrahydrobiopterin dehydratase [Rubripirellula tenax]TWU60114.1 putative pterin-4-alpha-carbinolamine dehydratase [Rubripirellula tenax]